MIEEQGASLSEVRLRIDGIDEKILRLLRERMEAALLARRFKTGVRDPERERQVLDSIRAQAKPPLDPDFAERLYRLIIHEARALQEKNQATS